MITNTRQIKITDNAFLDVTCEEWHAGGKRQTRTYGQVARGRAFGTWGVAPWELAKPDRGQIAKAVSDAMRDTTVRVERVEADGGCNTEFDFASPIFHFETVTKEAGVTA